MKITNWAIHGSFPYLSVWGTSWGHIRFKDGGPITTSVVKTLDLDSSKIQTLNSTYELEPKASLPWVLSRVGGDLCCLLNPVIHCQTCNLIGCKVCYADLDALFVQSCTSGSKMHVWSIIGAK